MDKLNRLFAGNPQEFAAAFGAATSDPDTEASQLKAMLCLEDGAARNEPGVVINLTAREAGLPFDLPVGSVRVRLKP